MQLSGRHKRCVDLAAKVAETSDYDMHARHGAVLIRGGSIVNMAPSLSEYCSFGMRFVDHDGNATKHAEINCILGIPRQVTEGSTMYVVRLDSEDRLRMSKPCPMCEAALRFVGVRRVFYTTDDGLEEMRL